MRFRTSLCLATLFLVCFTMAAWCTPLPAHSAAVNLQSTPDKQSLSGQMASWEIENSPYGEDGPGREHRPIPGR